MKKILSAVKHLHEHGICHRDLKPENFIFSDKSEDAEIKLIDFGFCCCGDQPLKVFCGTPSYMCPEIVSKREYLGPPADIWAMGILTYAMLFG